MGKTCSAIRAQPKTETGDEEWIVKLLQVGSLDKIKRRHWCLLEVSDDFNSTTHTELAVSNPVKTYENLELKLLKA